MRPDNQGDLDEFFAYVDEAISIAGRLELARGCEALPGERQR